MKLAARRAPAEPMPRKRSQPASQRLLGLTSPCLPGWLAARACVMHDVADGVGRQHEHRVTAYKIRCRGRHRNTQSLLFTVGVKQRKHIDQSIQLASCCWAGLGWAVRQPAGARQGAAAADRRHDRWRRPPPPLCSSSLPPLRRRRPGRSPRTTSRRGSSSAPAPPLTRYSSYSQAPTPRPRVDLGGFLFLLLCRKVQ